MAKKSATSLSKVEPDVKVERWVPSTKPKNSWKDFVRTLGGENGDLYWRQLHNIAMGVPWTPRLPDGSEGTPVVPTTADRIAALQYIQNMQFGKAVNQTKVVQAEKEARNAKDVSNLSDIELMKEAETILKLGQFEANEKLPVDQPLEVDNAWEDPDDGK